MLESSTHLREELGGGSLTALPIVETHRVGVLIFGSDQGLCGQFNEQIATHAMEQLEALTSGE